jgi:hypothetical protein
LHFKSSLGRFVHLPVPSEIFAERGKEIVKIFIPTYGSREWPRSRQPPDA